MLKIARERGVIRPRDIGGVEDASPYLRDLAKRGILVKVGRGLYTLADREPSKSFSLVQATARVRGVVCLISALEFHGFTTQIGYEVWIAVDHTGKLTIEDIPVRIKAVNYPVSFEDLYRNRGGNVWQHLRTFRKGLIDRLSSFLGSSTRISSFYSERGMALLGSLLSIQRATFQSLSRY